MSRKRITTEEYVKRAKEIHGNKYDYSQVNYINSVTKIKIICPEHGEFWQRPDGHLYQGHNCPLCSNKFKARNKYTTESFIEKSKEIHGNKYDYSKVDYKASNRKVCIICPEHGEFWITPSSHFLGHGCYKCSKRISNSEYIERAKKVHGNKYDYSKTKYETADKKVCIICSRHGEFWQEAYSHLKGCGCIKCFQESDKKSLEQFIEESNNIHNNKYDYSKVKYEKINEKVCIICPEHGEFWITPSSHIYKKAGCPFCSGVKKNTQQFIEESKKVHGDKYDYSKVEYKGSDNKVCIICPEHGEFWQRPNDHKSGYGCTECAIQNHRKTTEQFIENARKVHNHKYDYSRVEYIHNKKKVCIICPEHGEFWQSPNSHLKGDGCPKCNTSKGEIAIKLFLEKFTNLRFIHQYRSKWLKYQSLDFFFPKYNFGIEFDGEQHFRPVNFRGAFTEEQMIKNFHNIQRLDKEKNEKCFKNNIKLYRISYKDDIEKELIKILEEQDIKIINKPEISLLENELK